MYSFFLSFFLFFFSTTKALQFHHTIRLKDFHEWKTQQYDLHSKYDDGFLHYLLKAAFLTPLHLHEVHLQSLKQYKRSQQLLFIIR